MTDNRMIIATVVGTGIAMTTVIVAFSIGIIVGTIHDRITDVNTNLNRRIDDLQEQMRELRALVIETTENGEPADNSE